VFEPVLFCLFFLHASVNFVTFSIRYFRFSFTQFLFPDRISMLMLYILVETVSYFYFVYNSNHKDAQQIFAQQLLGLVPLNSKVLWSILSSTIIEILKKRWILLELICPKEENRDISEMEGMPPAYIVVDMSWDDPEDDLNEIENRKDDNDKIDAKNDKVEDNLDNRIEIKVQEYFQNYWRKHNSPYTHRYSLLPDNYWHLKIGNLFLDRIGKHQINEESFCSANGFCLNKLEVMKLSMMSKEVNLVPSNLAVIPGLLPYLPLSTCRPVGGGLYMCHKKTGSSTAEHHKALTKNMKGIWYTILAGKFNIFLANSAVGVVISLAFVNAQDIIDETEDYDTKTRENIWRKVKRKQKNLSTIDKKCYNFSPKNEEEPASSAATTPTPAY